MQPRTVAHDQEWPSPPTRQLRDNVRSPQAAAWSTLQSFFTPEGVQAASDAARATAGAAMRSAARSVAELANDYLREETGASLTDYGQQAHSEPYLSDDAGDAILHAVEDGAGAYNGYLGRAGPGQQYLPPIEPPSSVAPVLFGEHTGDDANNTADSIDPHAQVSAEAQAAAAWGDTQQDTPSNLNLRVVHTRLDFAGHPYVLMCYRENPNGRFDLELPSLRLSNLPDEVNAWDDAIVDQTKNTLYSQTTILVQDCPIQGLGFLPSKAHEPRRRHMYMLTSDMDMVGSRGTPPHMIPHWQNRSDEKFSDFTWVPLRQFGPDGDGTMIDPNGQYILRFQMLPSPHRGQMKEEDNQALRHFFHEVGSFIMTLPEAAPPQNTPWAYPPSPQAHVQFERGSWEPPPIAGIQSSPPARSIHFASPISQHMGPQLSAAAEMWKEGGFQRWLWRDPKPGGVYKACHILVERPDGVMIRFLDGGDVWAHKSALIPYQAHLNGVTANPIIPFNMTPPFVDAPQFARNHTLGSAGNSSQAHRETAQMRAESQFQKQIAALEAQQAQLKRQSILAAEKHALEMKEMRTVLEQTRQELARASMSASSVNVASSVNAPILTPQNQPFATPKPPMNITSAHITSAQPPPKRRPSYLPAPPPPALVPQQAPGLQAHPRHLVPQYGNQQRVTVIASNQQTGRSCFFNGLRGKSNGTHLNARDFIVSFQIIARAQGDEWDDAHKIAECKNRCSHYLDKQLMLLEPYEIGGWETWKEAFLAWFRHPQEDSLKFQELLLVKAKPDQPISAFNAYFNQLWIEVEQISDGAQWPDALMRHLYMLALPTALRTAIATAVKPEHTTTDIQYLCATSQFNAGAVPTPKEISKVNFDAITKDATAKIVEAIQTDTSAAMVNFMSAFERQDGDAAMALKLSDEERNRRRTHDLCFNEACSGQFEHNFREKEKCQDPQRRAAIPNRPRQTRFAPGGGRQRTPSPYPPRRQAQAYSVESAGETASEGDDHNDEESDFDPDSAPGSSF